MLNISLDNIFEQRCFRPIYQNQAVAQGWLLDEDWVATDGDIFPGTVMYNIDGEHAGVATSTNTKKPVGICGDFLAPAYGITEQLNGHINVWVLNKGALFDLDGPAVSSGMSTAVVGDLLKAGSDGLMVPLGASDASLAVAKINQIVDQTHFVVEGI